MRVYFRIVPAAKTHQCEIENPFRRQVAQNTPFHVWTQEQLAEKTDVR
jgi:hypothetical protein